jgi:hypothetical protein
VKSGVEAAEEVGEMREGEEEEVEVGSDVSVVEEEGTI